MSRLENTFSYSKSRDEIMERQKEKIRNLPREYKDIWNEMIMPVDTNISMNSVILSEENTSLFKQFIQEQDYREKLLKYGLKPMNRILMYGASGCGKTYSSKALSNHLGYTMLYIDIAKALTDETVSKNISNIFSLANYLGYCEIMLDECDAIAWQRDTSNSDTGTIRRATNSIFQCLDQMDSSNIFIAATNMLHRLDAAFERRFSIKMAFKRPDIDIKDAIRKFTFDAFEIVDDVDTTTENIISRRSSQYAKLSYYEIQGIVERAMKKAVISDTNKIYTSSIYFDLAVAMRVKINFHTDDDSPEIFENKNYY